MKHYSFLLSMICYTLIATTVQAQTSKDSLQDHFLNTVKLQPELRRILHQQLKGKHAAAMKVTNAELLVGSSVRFGGIAFWDSTIYKYSGNRGSNLTNNDINSYYDNFLPGSIDPVNHWDVAYLLYDTMITLRSNGSSLNYRSVKSRNYDALNNIVLQDLKIYNGASTITIHNYTNLTYDGTSNLLSSASYNDTSGTLSGQFQLTDSLHSSYDATNNRILDTIIINSGNPVYSAVYTYNTSSQMTMSIRKKWNPTASAWQNSSRSIYTYDTLGRIKTAQIENWISGVWALVASDSFGYTGSSYRHTFVEALSSNNGGRHIYTLTSFNAPDSIYEYYTNDGGANWMLASAQKLYYNANQHVTSVVTYSFDANNGTWYPTPYREDRFYYAWPQSVTDINKDEHALAVLYPNPATHTMTIKLLKRTSRVLINIYNMSGQLLRQRSQATSDDIKIDLGHLACGNYIAEVISNGRTQHIRFEKK